MNNTRKPIKRLSTSTAVLGIVFSIAILIIAQMLAFAFSEIPLNLGVPNAICNIIAGMLYAILAFIGAIILCKKFLKIPISKLRIPHFQVNTIWLIVAILMPVLVLIISMMIGGHWEVNFFDTKTTVSTITGAIFFYGLATGIVEELVFRGLIMGCLEQRFNIRIAVVVPSVLFGLLHIIGNSLDFISVIQLLIAGSIVGILFSLITYESNSIWNSAIVHGIWNMAIVGGILYIGNEADKNSIYNFVIEKKSFLLSGGDFGIEASVISIFIYLVICILAIILLAKNHNKTIAEKS